MLYAIIKKTDRPIKLVTWVYTEPGKLSSVRDSDGILWSPWALIPIGYKRHNKMCLDARDRAVKKADAEAKEAIEANLDYILTISEK